MSTVADPTIEQIEQERARRRLIHFTTYTKPDYKAGWFHKVVCDKLDQFLKDCRDKKSPRLILTAPPQHGKSELVSRRFPAYAFGKYPDLRITGTSYAADLAQSFNADIQQIIDSERYQELFPKTKIIGENSRGGRNRFERRNATEFTIIGEPGKYRCVGRGGPLTGRPTDILIIDDPLKDYEESISPVIREQTFNWMATVAMPRVQEGGGVILMQTRWHMDDPVGRLLDRMPGKWELVNFPALAETDEEYRKRGEPLTVERYSLEALLGIRDGGLINSYQWSALYQQRPSPEGGGLFKREDWRFYDVDAEWEFQEIIQSWDCTFKDTTGTDFVSGQVWGYIKANKYLIDRVNDRMNFKATKVAIATMSGKHPKALRKFIEDKANGPAVINDLKDDIEGLIAVEPMGGKIARANAVSGEVEAHNVFLPARKSPITGALVPLPWVHSFIEQHANFPSGTFDDDVDACTQALAQIRKLRIGHASDGGVISAPRKSEFQRMPGMRQKVF